MLEIRRKILFTKLRRSQNKNWISRQDLTIQKPYFLKQKYLVLFLESNKLHLNAVHPSVEDEIVL